MVRTTYPITWKRQLLKQLKPLPGIRSNWLRIISQ